MQTRQIQVDANVDSVPKRKTSSAWSIKKAIFTGHLMLTLPSFILFLIPVLISVFQMNHDEIYYSIVLLGIITGQALAWFYWSSMVTRWKIMAFSKVKNKRALKNHAIRSFILFKDGSLAERTEFKTYKQKKQLIEIFGSQLKEDRELKSRKAEAVELPQKTDIYFSNSVNFMELVFTMIAFLAGLILIVFNYWYLGICFTLAGLLGIVHEYRQYKNRLPQISISQKGIETEDAGLIKWGQISEIEVSENIRAKTPYEALKIVYQNNSGELETEWVEITDLAISKEELESVITEYKS
jgi:hypothetical protein